MDALFKPPFIYHVLTISYLQLGRTATKRWENGIIFFARQRFELPPQHLSRARKRLTYIKMVNVLTAKVINIGMTIAWTNVWYEIKQDISKNTMR